jgi:phospholipid/cholesterol/gamma-HCH transport system substrate-binding protein
MENRVNFTLVGTFVTIFTIALLGFIYWLGKYGGNETKYDHYTVFIDESVSGLNIESPVKFKGLDIGKVSSIQISPSNPEDIEVTLEIKHNMPIKANTYATVGMLGITGLKYVELLGGTKDAKLLTKNKDGIREIEYKKSLFTKLGNSADGIATKINTLLSNENIVMLESILKNTDGIFAKLNKNMDDEKIKSILENADNIIGKLNSALGEKNLKKVDNILANLQGATSELKKLTDSAEMIMKNDLPKTLEAISSTAIEAKNTIKTIDKEIEDGKSAIKDMKKDTLVKVDSIILELERTLYTLQNTIQNIDNSPSDILFKSSEIGYGPGERQ